MTLNDLPTDSAALNFKALATAGNTYAMPSSSVPDPPEITFLRVKLPCIIRQMRYGSQYKVYYSGLIPPPKDLGILGNLYILANPPTVFWKSNRWQPWTWKSKVFFHDGAGNGFHLNFDFKGPVWNSATRLVPSFENMNDAVQHFFNAIGDQSDLGTASKPIVVE